VLDAVDHHPPDLQQARAYVGLGTAGALVGQHHVADPQVVVEADLQQLDPGPERIRHRRRVRQQRGLAGAVVVQHEAAADGVVGALGQDLVVRVRGEGHAVRVEGQPASAMQDQVVLGVERDRVRSGEPQLTRALDLGGPDRSLGGVDGLGILALEPQSTAL
jgi:hypothetical protein